MKKALISLILVLVCTSAFSQDVIRHGRGEDIQQYLLDSIKFVSPDFQAGVITFKDGTFSRGPVNISTIEQRVWFVGTDGIKQVLVNEDDVARVTIKGRTFIKTQYGYMEMVQTTGDVVFGCVRRVSFLETEKKGAYGMASATTSVTTIGTLQEYGTTYTLGAEQDTPYIYKVIPYLYRNNRTWISNKKNFQKCFPDKKAMIEKYLKDNSLDLEKYKDAEKLFQALSAEE